MGEIVYTQDGFIAEQLVTLQSVLDSVKSNDKIFLPPIPPLPLVAAVRIPPMHLTLYCLHTALSPSQNISSNGTASLRTSRLPTQDLSKF